MKKAIFAIAVAGFLASCGGSTKTEPTTTDSTNVKADTTLVVDSTTVNADTTVKAN